MLYLILAIACSASIALICKHSETRKMNRYAVTSANYLTACVVSGALLTAQSVPVSRGIVLGSSWQEIGRALLDTGERLSPPASLVWAVIVGLGAGAVFLLGFIYY